MGFFEPAGGGPLKEWRICVWNGYPGKILRKGQGRGGHGSQGLAVFFDSSTGGKHYRGGKGAAYYAAYLKQAAGAIRRRGGSPAVCKGDEEDYADQ